MQYVSTRGQSPRLGFGDVVLTGLARDGGLYVPESWPQIDAATMRAWQKLSYAELASEIIALFAGDDLTRTQINTLCQQAYSGFSHPATAPMIQLEDSLWLMEQFHGPTLAFKDFAMQLLGPLMHTLLDQRGERRCIVGATSGDTGSAAIAALRGLKTVDVFMLHPHERVSGVQRRQMTTVLERNIHNIAVDGDFDDCQNLVKALFNDLEFRDQHALGAVNSINWARVAAQVVYYFRAALALGAPERAVSFSVPSGNFGNVFAGFVAKQMGLPIGELIVGSNRNDILTRFFASGSMSAEAVLPSLSPSMDIQISSNFERLLFEYSGRDSEQVRAWMQAFREHGEYGVGAARLSAMHQLFSAHCLSDEQTLVEMQRVDREMGYVIDPHSAIGVAAARACRRDNDTPMVVLATAHPAKFPDAVQRAVGRDAALPARMQSMMQAPERVQRMTADSQTLKTYIAQQVS